jgi:hypothetical protein
MKYIFLLALLLIPVTAHAQKQFYVDQVYVNSDYNARYILTFANEIVPVRGLSSEHAIGCLVTELNASGMFKALNVKLERRSHGRYNLHILPQYKGDPRAYRISDIVIDPASAFDGQKLLRALVRHGVNSGRLFMPYSDIEQAIGDTFDDLRRSDDTPSTSDPWIRARLTGNDQVRLIISRKGPICSAR